MNPLVRLVLAFAALALSAAAQARDIAVTVKDPAGHPVADAVVILDAPGRAPPPGHFTINQKNTMFMPFMLVIPVGSTVDFTNLDPFRHHVYSFSPAKKFELKLFGQGEKRAVTFDKPGVVALGCNIHDTMQAFIQVVDTPFAVKTGADGRVVLHGAPAGALRVTVWHPYLRAPGNQLIVAAPAGGDVALPVSIRLRRPAPMQHDY
ncbi:MAG: methylamine utilization protein [Porphyrobacter sp.]|nr:methylamine utilization protein [Porphyrobacter sp.]